MENIQFISRTIWKVKLINIHIPIEEDTSFCLGTFETVGTYNKQIMTEIIDQNIINMCKTNTTINMVIDRYNFDVIINLTN